ncbi:MAG TPA: ATP-binding protein [bacterium]|jgi:two-component system phosphate regulon sensor histidine kinase PhoR|nr:ATP-binding protein [bacterium]
MKAPGRFLGTAVLLVLLISAALYGFQLSGWMAVGFIVIGLVAALGLVYFLAPFNSNTEVKPNTPSVVSLTPPDAERDVYIPGRNFDEMLQRLGSNESMINVILNSMSEGVLLLNQADRIVLMNPSAEKILEMSEKDGLGKHYLEIVRHPVLADLLTESKKGGISSGEIEFMGKDERTFAVSVAAVRKNPELILGQIVVLSDITSMKRLMRMRTDFVANVSHELKTPLTAILGYVETLLEGAIDDKKNRGQFLKKISDQAQRLHALISDVLELSKIESGMFITSLEPMELTEVASQVVEVLKAKWESKEIAIHQDIPVGMRVIAHQEGLFHVFENLLDNAIKYSPEKSEIRVYSRVLEDGRVEFSVEDHGPGISAEAQSRVFERFFRVDASRSRAMGGTGLGLSIVKHLAEKMKGEVSLKSEEGKGSTFSLILSGVGRGQ